jgi:hypothetical protein
MGFAKSSTHPTKQPSTFSARAYEIESIREQFAGDLARHEEDGNVVVPKTGAEPLWISNVLSPPAP